MPGKVTPVVGYQMPGTAITMPVVRTGRQTPEISSGGGSGTADWPTRIQGAVRAKRLSDPADLGGGYQSNYGYQAGTSPPHLSPVIANGYLSFTRPSQTGSDPSGWWWMNFSDDLSVLFDVGDTFYTQVQTWWSQGWFDQIFLEVGGTHQAGIKLFGIVAGDHDGLFYTSNPELKIVIQGYYELRAPHAYGYTQTPGGATTYNFDESISGNLKLQNALPACLDSDRPQMTPASCFCVVPNTWMVWKTKTTIIDREIVNGRSCFNFTFRLWGAVLGQPPTLLIDWGPNTPGYLPLRAEDPDGNLLSFGKVDCFPYLSGQDPTQVTSACEARYRELIISTQDIADPIAPNPTLAALSANTAHDCGLWSGTNPGGSDQSIVWSDYSGITYDAGRRQMVAFGGGHNSTHYNALCFFKLDTLEWVEQYPPTKCSELAYPATGKYDRTLGAWIDGEGFWTDGGPYPRPIARHTEDSLLVVGDEFFMLQHVEGNANTCGWFSHVEDAESLKGDGRVPIWNLASNDGWTFTSTQSNGNNFPAWAYNPALGMAVGLTGSGPPAIWTFEPATRLLTQTLDLASPSGAARVQDEITHAELAASLLSYNNSMVYVPDDGTHEAWMGKFYYFARETGAMWRLTYDNQTPLNSLVERMSTSGMPCPEPTIVAGHNEVGLAWDSKNKLIGCGPVDGVFYVFNPASVTVSGVGAKSWAHQTIAGSTPGSIEFHCIDYCPVNNVYVFFDHTKHTWCYRWS